MNKFLEDWLAFSQSVDVLPVGALLQGGTTRQLTAGEVAAYEAPYPDGSYQASPKRFPMLIPVQPDNPGVPQAVATWSYLETWQKPFLTVFGDQDPVAYKAGAHRPFQRRIPGAQGQPHRVLEGAEPLHPGGRPRRAGGHHRRLRPRRPGLTPGPVARPGPPVRSATPPARPPEPRRHLKGIAMPTVETVRGPVDTAQLGRTYMHEHIFVLTPDVQQNYPEHWGDEEARVADAVAKLNALAASGVRTIVDPTVVGLGRYIPRIQRVAEQVPDLNIVVATGCYTYHDVPFFFHHRTPAIGALLGRDEPEPMVPMFVGDITEGIAGTGVRAGMLKCAIDEAGLTPGVERVMRAVARAHLATGCPITVHTHPGHPAGPRRPAGDGARRASTPGGWCSATAVTRTDVDHLSALAEAGLLAGHGPLRHQPAATTFEARADTVVELCRRGFAERMVLAHDAACYIDWIDPDVLPLLPAVALPPHRAGRAAVPARPRGDRGADHHHARRQPAPDLRRRLTGAAVRG